MMPTHDGWQGTFFTQSTHSYGHLSGDTLRDTPRYSDFPAMWASLSPVMLAHKIKHQRRAWGSRWQGWKPGGGLEDLTVVQVRVHGGWDQSVLEETEQGEWIRDPSRGEGKIQLA